MSVLGVIVVCGAVMLAVQGAIMARIEAEDAGDLDRFSGPLLYNHRLARHIARMRPPPGSPMARLVIVFRALRIVLWCLFGTCALLILAKGI